MKNENYYAQKKEDNILSTCYETLIFRALRSQDVKYVVMQSAYRIFLPFGMALILEKRMLKTRLIF